MSRQTRVATQPGVMTLLMVFMMINLADKAVLGLTAAPIRHEFGLSAAQFGGISSSFYILFSLASVVFGIIGTRFRASALLVVLALIWSLAQLPLLWTGAGIGILLLTRIVLGAGEGPAFPLANHTAFTWFAPARRTLPSSLITVGMGIGSVVGAPLIGIAVGHWGWRSAYGVLGALGVLWVVAWMIWGGTGKHDVAVERMESGQTGQSGRAVQSGQTVHAGWTSQRSQTAHGVHTADPGGAPQVTRLPTAPQAARSLR